MSVFPRLPGKLNPQFNCVGLYTMDGNFDDVSGAAPAANLSDTGGGDPTIFSSDFTGKLCAYFRTTERALNSGVSQTKFLILGDITVQAVVWLPTFVTDTNGINFFSFDGGAGAVEADNAAWKLSAINTGGIISPAFVWEQGAGTDVIIQDADFTLVSGLWYHIVGVREGTDARLYVNNQLIASGSALTLPTGGGNAIVRIGEEASSTQGYQNGSMVSSCKVSNRALTAQEITQEYNRVRGIV